MTKMTKKKVKSASAKTEVVEPPKADVMLKAKEAAQILSCSVVTIQRLIDSGQVPHVRVGNIQRIPQSSFMKFISDNTRGGRDTQTRGEQS